MTRRSSRRCPRLVVSVIPMTNLYAWFVFLILGAARFETTWSGPHRTAIYLLVCIRKQRYRSVHSCRERREGTRTRRRDTSAESDAPQYGTAEKDFKRSASKTV